MYEGTSVQGVSSTKDIDTGTSSAQDLPCSWKEKQEITALSYLCIRVFN